MSRARGEEQDSSRHYSAFRALRNDDSNTRCARTSVSYRDDVVGLAVQVKWGKKTHGSVSRISKVVAHRQPSARRSEAPVTPSAASGTTATLPRSLGLHGRRVARRRGCEMPYGKARRAATRPGSESLSRRAANLDPRRGWATKLEALGPKSPPHGPRSARPSLEPNETPSEGDLCGNGSEFGGQRPRLRGPQGLRLFSFGGKFRARRPCRCRRPPSSGANSPRRESASFASCNCLLSSLTSAPACEVLVKQEVLTCMCIVAR